MSRKDLGEKVKQARKIKSQETGSKFTQSMLADELGISRGYLGDVESGRIYPNYVLLNKIAGICGIPFSFFAEEDIPEPSPDELKHLDSFDISKLERVIGRLIKIPVLGKITAGIPVDSEENIIEYVEVPESEVRNGPYFYLQVTGDSMIGSRIYDGDRVLIRKQPEVEDGEVAVVRINSHEATLKRVKRHDGQVILYPDNPNYDPIIIKEEGAEIIGKVVKVEFNMKKKSI
jgi:repressor LexA